MDVPPIRIPIFDSTIQHRRLLPALEAALRDVLLGAQWDVVPQVRDLEREMSAELGGGYAVGVQSGTAALFLILKALGIGPDDDVVTVSNSDISTTAAISHTGARFVLCDIEPQTMTMDPADLERRITPRTRAILPVHLYGHPADMGPIMEIARARDLLVVEDAALALGATYHGEVVGLIGAAGAVSFAAHKVIGGAGNGGMALTRDPNLAERLRLLRGYGQHPTRQELPATERHRLGRLEHLVEGYNLRLDSLQAAIVRAKLPHLRAWQAERQALADRYAGHFAGTPVLAPVVRAGCTHAWRNYIVRVPERDRVRENLLGRGIGVNTLYTPPVHLQPVYAARGLGRGSFPVAERAADELLGLPMYPGLAPEAVDEVAGAVLDTVTARRGTA